VRRDPGALLPWYLNDTLSAAERRAVESWLEQGAEAEAGLAAWQQVQQAVAGQPEQVPSPAVWQRVSARVRARPAPKRASVLPRLAWGVAATLAVLIALWTVLQPGIVLAWTVQGGPLTAFRVYRAPVGTADFGLVGEVPVVPGVQQYRYVDARPWTAQAYVYRVEAIGTEGRPLTGHTTSASALEALPGQVAVLLASLIAGCVAVVLARGWWGPALAAGKAWI
jgi:anti-sigma factor RsiW